MVEETTVPDESTSQETTEEVVEETQQEESQEVDYRARYEEAQRLITEKSQLVAEQERLIRASAEIIRGNVKAEPENNGADQDDFDSVFEGIDFDKLIDNPKEVMKMAMSKTYQKAKADAQKELVQKFTQNQAYVQNVQKAQQEFYGAKIWLL